MATDGVLHVFLKMINGGVKYSSQEADLKSQLRSICHSLESLRPVPPVQMVEVKILAALDKLIEQSLMMLRINTVFGDELLCWQMKAAQLPMETRMEIKREHSFLMFALNINEVYPLRHYLTKAAVEIAVKRACSYKTNDTKLVAKLMVSALAVRKARWFQESVPQSPILVKPSHCLPENVALRLFATWYNTLFPPGPLFRSPPHSVHPGQLWETEMDTSTDTNGTIPFSVIAVGYIAIHRLQTFIDSCETPVRAYDIVPNVDVVVFLRPDIASVKLSRRGPSGET